MLARLRSLVRTLTGRARFEETMSDELRFHIEQYTADLVRAGLPEHDAVRRARLELGGLDVVKQNCRESRGLRPFDELRQDLRYGVRRMWQAPFFTSAVVLSLGLGIGANTAIFSLMDAILFRTLAVADPQALYFLAHGEAERPSTSANYPLLEHYRDRTSVFSGIATYSTRTFRVASDGDLEMVPGQFVSGNYHAVVGAPFVLGRGFASEPDRRAGGSPIAVISERYWTERFGRDADVLGRSLVVQGHTVTIVGVTAQAFAGLVPGTQVDVTVPLSVRAIDEPDFLDRHDSWTSMPLVARLKPQASEARAAAELDAVFQQYMDEPENRWARENTPDAYTTARLLPAGRGTDSLRALYATPLQVLLILVAVVLLVATTNVASLLLARVAARSREVAIRLCIGGGRARLVRQFLTESTLLAVCGGLLGAVLAVWGTNALLALFRGGPQPLLLDATPSLRVLGVTALVSVTVGIAVGLIPALQSAGADLTPALRAAPDDRGRRYRNAIGKVLVVGQLSLALVVVAVAGLLGRSLYNLQTQDAGFRADSVLLFSVTTAGTTRSQEGLQAFYSELVERLAGLPGVTSASMSLSSPIDTSGTIRGIEMPGLPRTPEARGVWANTITPDFFETFGIGLLRGRPFTPRDGPGSGHVAIVNETLARFYFKDDDPVGREISFMSAPEEMFTIVGIVRDVHQESLRKAPPRMVYTPLAQATSVEPQMTAQVRTARDPVTLANDVRAVVASLGGDAVVARVRTMQQQIDTSLVRERAMAMLATSLGVLVLVLACVGLYALMAYDVTRRSREIGIRMALGATQRSVLVRVLRDSLTLSAAGVTLGIVGALGATEAVAALLFGLTPRDPATLGAVVALLVATTFVAAWLPARRAACLDPARTLRAE